MDVVTQKCGEILLIYFPQNYFPTYKWEPLSETWLMGNKHIYIPFDILDAIYWLTLMSIDTVKN